MAKGIYPEGTYFLTKTAKGYAVGVGQIYSFAIWMQWDGIIKRWFCVVFNNYCLQEKWQPSLADHLTYVKRGAILTQSADYNVFEIKYVSPSQRKVKTAKCHAGGRKIPYVITVCMKQTVHFEYTSK